jgi:tetratricopeptide (TPR) repeat protein
MAKPDKSSREQDANQPVTDAAAAALAAPKHGSGHVRAEDAVVAGSSRFTFSDKCIGLALWLVSLALYVYTLQPNVGLEDSGEFIAASDHFGVPHPPGYPLWSLLTFLLAHGFPFGNIAWRVNLFSALCGATAVGLFGMLMSHSVRWMLSSIRGIDQKSASFCALVGAATGGLVLAFSDVMWSQAVIAEVYCLNAVFLAMLLICFYKWMHDPTKTQWLVGTAFSLALGMTNHHTLLFVCPAFVAGVFLVTYFDRRLDIFRDFMVAFALTCVTVTAMFGWLSGTPEFQQTCARLIVVGLAFAALIAVWLNRDCAKDKAWLLSGAVVIIGGLAWSQVTDPGKPGTVPTINPAFQSIALVVLLLTAAASVGLGLAYLRQAGATLRARVWGGALVAGGAALILLSQVKWFTDAPVKLGEQLPSLLVTGLVIAGAVLGFFGRQFNWRLIASIVGVTWVGLVFYGYMQVASSTNPPMNWGYASERQGLFHAINRGQYSDNMVVVLQHYIAPLVGLPKGPKPQQGDTGDLKGAERVMNQLNLYWGNLKDNMHLVVCLLPLGLLIYIANFRLRVNLWLIFLVAAFALLTVLLLVLMNPGLDLQSQWVNKTFTLQSHCIFSVWVAAGVACGLLYLRESLPGVPALLLWIVPAISLLPFRDNYWVAEQRDRWYGWMYGVDMLRDCDRDAVIFGGTDPGRFVPTYTIFCESTQDDKWKPWLGEAGDGPQQVMNPKYPEKFDRRDLYIITQNALADGTYMKYIRSHYDKATREAREEKAKSFSPLRKWFEKALDRDGIYPKKPLILPTEDEVNQCFAEYVRQSGQAAGAGGRVVVQGIQGVFAINGMISKLIFDKNKESHAFYVEESFPMDWYYPHAEPFGLCIKVNKEPLTAITPEMIARDRSYWDNYTAKLMKDRDFVEDRPASMSFSKLRLSIANIYSWRGQQPSTAPEDRTRLFAEAEYAYRQALKMAPSNSEAAFRLAEMLMNLARFPDALKVVEDLNRVDEHNPQIPRMRDVIVQRQTLFAERAKLEPGVASGQAPLQDKLRFMGICQQLGDRATVAVMGDRILADPGLNVDLLKQLATFFFQGQMPELTARAVERLLQFTPNDARLWYDLAVLYASTGKLKEGVNAAQRAIRLGGETFRQNAARDARLAPLMGQPEFQRLLSTPGATPAAPGAAPLNPFGQPAGGMPMPLGQ